jgi:hypothetical protein
MVSAQLQARLCRQIARPAWLGGVEQEDLKNSLCRDKVPCHWELLGTRDERIQKQIRMGDICGQ